MPKTLHITMVLCHDGGAWSEKMYQLPSGSIAVDGLIADLQTNPSAATSMLQQWWNESPDCERDTHNVIYAFPDDWKITEAEADEHLRGARLEALDTAYGLCQGGDPPDSHPDYFRGLCEGLARWLTDHQGDPRSSGEVCNWLMREVRQRHRNDECNQVADDGESITNGLADRASEVLNEKLGTCLVIEVQEQGHGSDDSAIIRLRGSDLRAIIEGE